MRDNIINDMISECVKCGRCLSVCPVYIQLRDEIYSSRGRVALFDMLNDDSFIAQDMKDSLDKCLVCLRCRGVCEKDVKYLDLISMIKAREIKKSLSDRLISNALMNVDILTRLSRIFPKELFALFTREYSDSSFFYMKLIKTPVSRIFPNYYNRPAYLKKEIKNELGKLPEYLYFPGCGSNLILSKITRDTISLLNMLKIPFIIPAGLSCCGFPLYYNGFDKKAEEVKSRNLEIFSKTPHKKIITTCPTCRTSLIEWYGFDEEKVVDISAVLKSFKHLFKSEEKKETAFHQPCHFTGKHPVNSARDILDDIFGELFSTVDSCCGGGGSFFVKNNSLSLSILQTAVEKFNNPAQIISSCPLCMLRLADGVHRYKSDIPILHVSTLLLSLLKGGSKQ